jgi:hypothetical protein
MWKGRKNLIITQGEGNLNIIVTTHTPHVVKNSALLKTRLKLMERPLLLSLEYGSNSSLGSTIFKIEIGDRKEGKLLFSSF